MKTNRAGAFCIFILIFVLSWQNVMAMELRQCASSEQAGPGTLDTLYEVNDMAVSRDFVAVRPDSFRMKSGVTILNRRTGVVHGTVRLGKGDSGNVLSMCTMEFGQNTFFVQTLSCEVWRVDADKLTSSKVLATEQIATSDQLAFATSIGGFSAVLDSYDERARKCLFICDGQINVLDLASVSLSVFAKRDRYFDVVKLFNDGKSVAGLYYGKYLCVFDTSNPDQCHEIKLPSVGNYRSLASNGDSTLYIANLRKGPSCHILEYSAQNNLKNAIQKTKWRGNGPIACENNLLCLIKDDYRIDVVNTANQGVQECRLASGQMINRIVISRDDATCFALTSEGILLSKGRDKFQFACSQNQFQHPIISLAFHGKWDESVLCVDGRFGIIFWDTKKSIFQELKPATMRVTPTHYQCKLLDKETLIVTGERISGRHLVEVFVVRKHLVSQLYRMSSRDYRSIELLGSPPSTVHFICKNKNQQITVEDLNATLEYLPPWRLSEPRKFRILGIAKHRDEVQLISDESIEVRSISEGHVKWRTTTPSWKLMSYQSMNSPVNCVVFGDASVAIYDFEQPCLMFQSHIPNISSVTVSPGGNYVAFGTHTGKILLFTVDGDRVAEVDADCGNVTCLTFNANATKIASCGSDRVVRIWDCIVDQ